MKKIHRRILSFGIALSMLLSAIITSNASTDIQVTVSNNPKIDVMLSSKETNVDLSTFKEDIIKELHEKGINTDNINFITAITKTMSAASDDVDFAKVVNSWTKIGMGNAFYVNSNGHLTLDLTSTSPAYPGYGGTTTYSSNYTPEYNYQLCAPGWYGEGAFSDVDWQNLHIEAVCDSSGYLNTGLAFNVSINEDGTINGYFVNTCYHGGSFQLYRFDNYALDDYFSHGINAAMWCSGLNGSVNLSGANQTKWYGNTKLSTVYDTIHDVNGNNAVQVVGAYSPNAGKNSDKQSYLYRLGTIGASKSTQTYWDIQFETATGKITVMAGTSKGASNIGKIVVYDDTYLSGAFGVWGNNCEQKASTVYKTYSASGIGETFLTYKEILTQPTWREDAKHVVVNVDDIIDDTLTGKNTIGEVLSRTLADDIHFIQWGTDANKAATTNFIKQNDNKGTFTYSNNYDQAVKDTATYIKGLIEQESSEEYIAIGQEIDLTVTPSNLKTNATSTDYPNGRWKIEHNYKHFTNNLGQSADAGIYSPNLNCNFDKPGEYKILFDDELVKIIYVHRKPVADFEISIENLQVTLNSLSYDLDSDTNNGIASEKWYYKEASAYNWTEGKLTQLDKTKIYVIKLEVEDFQGATNYTTKYVGTGNPVAKFNFANNTICKYNQLEIKNSSYDPVGYDITTQSWELKKNGQVIGTYSEPVLDFNTTNLGPGNYTYTLTITNSVGTKSESYTKSFTVVDDVAKPEVSIEAEVNNNWNTETDVDVEISDNESNVAKWRYEFVTSPTPTTTDGDWSNWDTENTKVTVNSGALSGRYYLHIQAYDSANNLTERTVGPFNLDNTNPVINGVDVDKLGFRETKVTIDAFDEHSGIVGYALTKYETATFSARTFAAVETPEFQESNEFMVDEDGLYTAWAIDALGNVETSVCEVTQSNQTDKTTTVYAEIGSEFKVTIPKKIVLDGATKSGTYTVTVEGDIAGLEVINVTPDSAVTLSSKDKADVIGTITQDKLNWTYSEIYTDSKILANGSISASGITAGAWNGTFNFAIKLENNGKYTNSEWYVEYQDVTFDMEELDNSENENIE